jgi:hypothetical protein
MTENNSISSGIPTESGTAPSKSFFRDILNGSILTREVFITHLGYILFLAFLGVFYIGNRYHSEMVIKKIVTVTREARDARSEAILTSSELLQWKNQSNVYQLVKKKNLGLKPLVEPPKKLYLDE